MEWRDEIVDEVREARDAYASRFNYDLERMLEDLKAKEAEHPWLMADIPHSESRQDEMSPG